MTQGCSPYENALAERVNGILKNEFLPKKIYQNHKEAKKNIIIIIDHYNVRRLHSSLDYFGYNVFCTIIDGMPNI
jgi:putative transposase